jgi:hypothetical protein
MKTIFNISVVTCLLVAASSRCLAVTSFEIVSKARAKELGMEIRSKPSTGTNGVRVELEFNAEGEFKNFSPDGSINPEGANYVELRMTEGENALVTAALRLNRGSPGHLKVSFDADRAQMEKISLWVVVGSGDLPGGAYELRMKDFVDPGSQTAASSALPAPAGTRQPAATPQPAAARQPPAARQPAERNAQ